MLKTIKSPKQSKYGPSLYTFFNRSFSSSPLSVKFVPKLQPNSKAIIPISMSRYDGDLQKRKKYDEEIQTLLEYTAKGIKKGYFQTVDVVSAAGLQELTWGKEKSQEIESYFFKTHIDLLNEQTGFYTFEQLKEKVGIRKFEKCFSLVTHASQPDTHWFHLMEKAYQSTRVGGGLEASLTYQRTEYAAILAMSGIYSNIIYMGNLSLAWSYLYKLHSHKDLPIFTRAAIEKVFKKDQISSSEARREVDEMIRKTERILTNNYFPEKEKGRLEDTLTSFFYAYSPKPKPESVPEPKVKDSFKTVRL